MSKDWMPPLPEKRVVYTQMPDDYRYGHKYAYTEEQMRDYAEQYLAAWIKAQKPVAWSYEHDGCMDPPIISQVRWNSSKEPWTETQLYRLDGGEDE